MTDLLRPLEGFVPSSEHGSRIVGPPSATLTADQRELASGDRLSFRYAAGRKAGCSLEAAKQWIDELADQGSLLRTGEAAIVYQQQQGDFLATGLLGDISLEAYESGRVKRHEKTIAKTQQRMAKYMRTTRVYGNPAVLAVRPNVGFEDGLRAHKEREPDSAFTTMDGIGHRMWLVEGDAARKLCGLLDTDLYITDGHHRLAAASLVASDEGRTDASLPVGVFSANEFRLRSFARCIFDSEFDTETVVAGLSAGLEVEEVSKDEAFPRSRFEIGAKVRDRYFRCRIPQDRIPEERYESLNTNLIQQLVLGPVFGISHPRLDQRLKFVADLGDIQQTCAAADAWLLPFPLQVDDVMAVADSSSTMPAKSTWFAPKLPSGLVIRLLDRP